jgi:hypothetical protein
VKADFLLDVNVLIDFAKVNRFVNRMRPSALKFAAKPMRERP